MLIDLVTGPQTTNGHSHPGLLEHLRATAAGQTTYGEPGHTSTHHRANTTPRYNPKASQLLHDTHTLMARITSYLPFCATSTTPLGASTEVLALRAAAHTRTLSRHPDAGHTYRELAGLTRRILSIIDRPAPRHRIPCLCGNQLSAPIDATTVICERCGIVATLEDLERDHMRAAIRAGETFTLADLPVALAIAQTPASPRTIRHWRHTGQLPVVDYTEAGEPVYRPADLHRP